MHPNDRAPLIAGLIVVGIVGAIIMAAVLAGCGSWQKTTRTSLMAAHSTGKAAHEVLKEVCRPVLARCIEHKTNPCPALDECQAKRKPVLGALDGLQRAVLLGLISVDVADKPSALRALQLALSMLAQVREHLSQIWGVRI